MMTLSSGPLSSRLNKQMAPASAPLPSLTSAKLHTTQPDSKANRFGSLSSALPFKEPPTRASYGADPLNPFVGSAATGAKQYADHLSKLAKLKDAGSTLNSTPLDVDESSPREGAVSVVPRQIAPASRLGEDVDREQREPQRRAKAESGYERVNTDKSVTTVGGKTPKEQEVACEEVSFMVAADTPSPLMRLEARLVPFVQQLASRALSTAFADVTLCADNVDFPCHRIVLASNSAYFAALFEHPPKDVSQQRVELPGKTSDGVRSVLRVMYFEATPREILAEDVRRAVEILDIAREWILPDVMEHILNYVEREVNKMEELEWLCEHLGFSNEPLQMRQICETRLVKMHEEKRIEEEDRLKREFGNRRETPAADDRGQIRMPAGGRWPAGAVRRAEHWSANFKCPKGLGW